jgi:hypothetical protein
MLRWGICGLVAVIALAFPATMRAEEPMASTDSESPSAVAEKSEQPDADAEAKAAGRLIKPWNLLFGLTNEQKDQIKKVHAEGVAERKASQQREDE